MTDPPHPHPPLTPATTLQGPAHLSNDAMIVEL